MKVFKSKTIDSFVKLNQSQSLAIRGGCCDGGGRDQPPPPPEETTQSSVTTTSTFGG